MTKNLNKITKKLSKKKGKLDSLHEKSRDAVRLRRAGGREEKLARAAATTMKGRQIYGEFVRAMHMIILSAHMLTYL